MDVTYLEVCKASDTVPHNIPLNWRDTDLVVGWWSGRGIGEMFASRKMWSKDQCPDGDW